MRAPAVVMRGFVLLCLLASAAVGSAWAADFQPRVPVRTLAVQISGFHKDWARRGFEEAQLYAEVETRLQAAGYTVISPAALKDHADAALLSLELHVNNTLVNWSYLVFLKLKVKVPVPVNPAGFVTRTVWSDWRIGGIELDFPGRLRGPIFELLREFQSRP